MSLRNSGQIYDDDITLLTIQLGADDVGIAQPMSYLTTEMPHAQTMPAAEIPVAVTTPHAAVAQEQKGSTFLVREKGKKGEKTEKSEKTRSHEKVESAESTESKASPEAKPQFQAPQFRSLDQPSVLKQIGKSIIGLLGKKEKEDEE
jgi:hypothetical protein